MEFQAALSAAMRRPWIDHVPERRSEVERVGWASWVATRPRLLAGQPVLVLLRLEHDHLRAHDRVAGAAVLRAEIW